MREIKFRAFNEEYKLMEYGVAIIDGAAFKLQVGRDDGDTIESVSGIRIKGPRMQFTGLRDKNSKEIYEGDIVSFYGASPIEYTGEIKFNDGCFDIENVRFRDYLKVYVGNHAVEVIGNRFENPELLNKGENKK